VPWGKFCAGRDIRNSGRVHIQSVDAQALAAAQRLQARGSTPVDSFIRKVVKRAVERVNRHAHREVLKPIRFAELRHSFVTRSKRKAAEASLRRELSGDSNADAGRQGSLVQT
jgi:hypothetical protein